VMRLPASEAAENSSRNRLLPAATTATTDHPRVVDAVRNAVVAVPIPRDMTSIFAGFT